ncbi:gluconokinase [Salinibacterium metalliresistens]|uniref:gluconokinase n=1 Tax=Salinibacterium metalliresistens TaxID=3031321 RepID=UPI0030B82E6E
MPTLPLIVVMGPSGSGKSTIGAALAAELGVPFMDADDLHPASNVAKMAAGQPLDDDDRWPWLRLVGEALAAASDTGLVMACSALRRRYRDAIVAEAPGTVFVELHGTRALLAERMGAREGHFMPSSLLDSQLATLESLGDDERGVRVDVSGTVPEIVADVIARVR